MRKRFSIVSLWILSLLFLMLNTGCVDEEDQTKSNIIKLAAILPMSGELGSKGEIRKQAIEKGVEDANEKWKEEGLNLQFDLKVEDGQSDPKMALEKAKQLWEEGYKIFIAGSSAEIEKLQPWATDNGAIVISYSSTSPSLGMVGDGVFRMVPDDTQQAKALASLLEYEGIYGIVPILRDDVYGRELTKLLSKEFKSLQGIVSEPVKYQPQETDWDHVMGEVSKAVNNLEMEKERIAVVLVSFDEIADIFLASEEEKTINEVRWFGTDTVTLSPIILEDKQIAKNASQVKLTGVTFGIPESDLFHSVQAELGSHKGGDFLPDAMFAYDTPLMLATVIGQLNDPFSTVELMNHLVEGSAAYAGVTGWTLLNEKGDRTYFQYDIWEVQTKSEDSFEWNQTAKYLRSPGFPGYISPN
ncbi:ABC transporter substrate-binding protein [Bacillus massilinigeriensis]|uniref:ABC transporter substrate-binding protein n=1 Tax=Bacillus massilionigeriensis TaxID=1805475 RepID=UPI00096AE8DB|nr:ABC transporter substrate-binding protein [Bacillus massilionigeriensis]